MNRTIDMKDMMEAIKRRWILFFCLILLFCLGGGWVGYSIPPAFEAETDLLVNSRKTSEGNLVPTMSEIETNIRLIQTYTQIMKSDRLISEVNEELGNLYSKSDLLNSVKINSGNGSQIITIIARAKTPEQAALLANKYAFIFQEEIRTLMNLDNITILNDVIETDTKMIKPLLLFYLVISFVTGFLISLTVIIVEEVYYPVLNNERKIERALDIPLIGSIYTRLKKNRKTNNLGGIDNSIATASEFPRAVDEDFNKLATNVHYLINQKQVKIIMMTSFEPKVGKTFVGSTLAARLAMDGQKTLFIDADLRKSDGRLLFNLPERKGLTSVISGFYKLDDVIQKTGTDNLFFISTGPIPLNSVKFLLAEEMGKLLDELKELFDVIVIDTPALSVADGFNMLPFVDGCILITHAKRTKEEKALHYLRSLERVNAAILGVVLNGKGKGKRKRIGKKRIHPSY